MVMRVERRGPRACERHAVNAAGSQKAVQSWSGAVAFAASVDARGVIAATGLALVTCADEADARVDAEADVAEVLSGADNFGSARGDADAECDAVPISRAAVAAACGAAPLAVANVAVTLRATTTAEPGALPSAPFTRNALTVSRKRPA